MNRKNRTSIKTSFAVLLLLVCSASTTFAEIVRKTIVDEDKKGYVYTFFENDKVIAKQIFDLQGELVNEDGQVPNGPVIEYYESGNVKEKIQYVNSRINGLVKSYYEDGQLSSEGTMRNGNKPDGLFKMYHKNGQLKVEMSFKNDKQVGIGKRYFENGKLQKEIYYSEEGFSPKMIKEYYENGKIKHEIETVIDEDNIPFSVERNYDQNGKLIK